MRRWLTILLAVIVVAALAIAGCGSKSTGGSSPSSTAGQELTAQQIFEKGMAASAEVKSEAFALDASLAVKGDPSKAPDAQSKALMQSPVTVTAKGAMSNDPQKANMTVSLSGAGQTFDVGLRVDGDNIWVQFMDEWYVVPKEMLSGMTGASPAPSASSGDVTQQMLNLFKQLGIDPTAWAKEWKLVGVETVDGTEVYHLQLVLDSATMIDDLIKASSGLGALTGGIGSSASPSTQQDLEDAAKILKESMQDVTVDWYFQKGDYYLRRMQVGGSMDFTSNADAQKEGVSSVDYSLKVTVGEFGKEVTVTPPANPKSFDQLINSLMGSSGISL